jgi:hypothetical protein
MDTQPVFFDLEHRYERLMSAMNFEALCYRLEKALKRSDGSKGGSHLMS